MPPEAAARARQKLMKRARKKQKTVSEQAKRLAGYVAILTIIDRETLADNELLRVYRIRWQIELFFKRCKSIIPLDKIPARDPASVQTFVLAKLIEVAILDRTVDRLRRRYDESLLGMDPKRPALTQWRLIRLFRMAYQHALREAYPARPASPERLVDALDLLRERKRKRKGAAVLVQAIHRLLNPNANVALVA